MSDALSFAEVDGQHVELLPARTVLGLIDILNAGDAYGGDGGTANQENAQQGGGSSHNNQDADGGNATGGKVDLLKGFFS